MRGTLAADTPGRRWWLRLAALLLVVAPIAACRVSDDAIAASSQMNHTAAALSGYYSALAGTISDTVALYELDAASSGIPFNEDQRKLPEETRAEILKREEMAESLAKLAQAMTTLSQSKAATDVAASATSLGNELVAVRALPGGSPVPVTVPKAGQFLVQLVQEHEERKAAKAMDEAVAALAELFEQEKRTYDSLASTHLRQASVVAKDLIAQSAVNPAPMLEPALKPFDLAPLPPNKEMQQALKALALARLDRTVQTGTANATDASAAMLEAMKEMSRRIHALAAGKALKLHGDPSALERVNAWSASVSGKGV